MPAESLDAAPPGSIGLKASREWDAPWRRWRPYLSERQWGTVREDFSDDGNAWQYFPHDHARHESISRGARREPVPT